MLQALSRKPQILSLSTKTPNLRFHLSWFKNLDSILLLRRVSHPVSLNRILESYISILSHLNLNSRKSQPNSFCSFSKVKVCLLSQSIFAKTIIRWWMGTILNNLHLWVIFVTTTWVTLWWTCLLQTQTIITTSCLNRPSLTLSQLLQPISPPWPRLISRMGQ